MKLAIMQPYFLPYIGYFQLINAVNKFIIYDDVNFIKGGWINKNNLLREHQKKLFTLPLTDLSSFVTIEKTRIDAKQYPLWSKKFKKTLSHTYKKAPFYIKISELIFSALDTPPQSISNLNTALLKQICSYLSIQTEFVDHSSLYQNSNLHAQERILDICKQEETTHYINPVGGIDLYDKNDFLEKDIQLSFIQSGDISYKQFNHEFIPNLSIIDVLMFNSVDDIKKMLNNFNLT